MRSFNRISGILFALIALFISTQAYAQSENEGIDVRFGVGGNFMRITHDKFFTDEIDYLSMHESSYNGLSTKISAGYRWNYIGVYIDQELGCLWSDNKEKDKYFQGATTAVFRVFWPISYSLQADFGIGLGAMYGSGDRWNDKKEDNFKPALIMNDKFDPSGAFAIKLAFSASYYVTPTFGIGIYLDYVVGIKNIKPKDYTFEATVAHNVINPGIQLMFRI